MPDDSHNAPAVDNFVGSLDKRLFWDVDIADIDAERHKRFIIQRVLERGGLEDWRLLKNHYTLPTIVEETQQMRSLEPHALALIACIAELPREAFRCYISKQLNQKHWSY